MKALVKHLIENHLAEIVDKSLLNCHAIGLHSIMLLDTPEKRIRLFVCDEDNTLYRNLPEHQDKHPMSIAFHPHHSNVTLHCVHGEVLNWVMAEKITGRNLIKYSYQSQITSEEGKMAFVRTGQVRLKTQKLHWMSAGDSINMGAKEIHTIGCHEGEIAAWFVFEGKEDVTYDPVCYTNAEIVPDSGLYLKPTKNEVLGLLALAGVI